MNRTEFIAATHGAIDRATARRLSSLKAVFAPQSNDPFRIPILQAAASVSLLSDSFRCFATVNEQEVARIDRTRLSIRAQITAMEEGRTPKLPALVASMQHQASTIAD